MDNLKIEATEDTPHVEFDKNQNIFKITGRSLPENAQSFYLPIGEWLKEYVKKPNNETSFEFHLEYFNSASSKQILHLLNVLIVIPESDNQLEIKWIYQKNDDLIEEEGQEFSEIIDFPFNFVAI